MLLLGPSLGDGESVGPSQVAEAGPRGRHGLGEGAAPRAVDALRGACPSEQTTGEMG